MVYGRMDFEDIDDLTIIKVTWLNVIAEKSE